MCYLTNTYGQNLIQTLITNFYKLYIGASLGDALARAVPDFQATGKAHHFPHLESYPRYVNSSEHFTEAQHLSYSGPNLLNYKGFLLHYWHESREMKCRGEERGIHWGIPTTLMLGLLKQMFPFSCNSCKLTRKVWGDSLFISWEGWTPVLVVQWFGDEGIATVHYGCALQQLVRTSSFCRMKGTVNQRATNRTKSCKGNQN